MENISRGEKMKFEVYHLIGNGKDLLITFVAANEVEAKRKFLAFKKYIGAGRHGKYILVNV
jgi:hypothetical protein